MIESALFFIAGILWVQMCQNTSSRYVAMNVTVAATFFAIAIVLAIGVTFK